MTFMEQTTTIKSLVLDRVRQSSPRPTQLIRELRDEAYPAEIQSALSDLIDEGEIFFSSDRRLRIATNTLAHAKSA